MTGGLIDYGGFGGGGFGAFDPPDDHDDTSSSGSDSGSTDTGSTVDVPNIGGFDPTSDPILPDPDPEPDPEPEPEPDPEPDTSNDDGADVDLGDFSPPGSDHTGDDTEDDTSNDGHGEHPEWFDGGGLTDQLERGTPGDGFDWGSGDTDSGQSDDDRQTYDDVAPGDGSESGMPGAGTPQADLTHPDPNENTDGDAVGVDEDGTPVYDPDQSERESEERNELDEGAVPDGTEYVDNSGDQPQNEQAGDDSGSGSSDGMSTEAKAAAALALAFLAFGGE